MRVLTAAVAVMVLGAAMAQGSLEAASGVTGATGATGATGSVGPLPAAAPAPEHPNKGEAVGKDHTRSIDHPTWTRPLLKGQVVVTRDFDPGYEEPAPTGSAKTYRVISSTHGAPLPCDGPDCPSKPEHLECQGSPCEMRATVVSDAGDADKLTLVKSISNPTSVAVERPAVSTGATGTACAEGDECEPAMRKPRMVDSVASSTTPCDDKTADCAPTEEPHVVDELPATGSSGCADGASECEPQMVKPLTVPDVRAHLDCHESKQGCPPVIAASAAQPCAAGDVDCEAARQAKAAARSVISRMTVVSEPEETVEPEDVTDATDASPSLRGAQQ